jgi:Asp-tRNA(Asn)/Glu-tRNA(Gln) amidotransferase A subunit family amidase
LSESRLPPGRLIKHLASLPDWPYDSLDLILFAEAAAAFEELTLAGGLKELKAQVPDAWLNLFRQARFLSAVDFCPSRRFRRSVAQEMARIFSQVDLLLVPSPRDEILTVTNFTGHPSLTLRAGFVEVSEARSDWAPDPAHPLPKFAPARRVPHGVTLIGRLFDEGVVGRAGLALERAFNVAGQRPPGSDSGACPWPAGACERLRFVRGAIGRLLGMIHAGHSPARLLTLRCAAA